MRSNFYTNVIVIAAILNFHMSSSFGQNGFFQQAPENARLQLSVSKHVDKYFLYRLKVDDLRSYLLTAPLEFKSNGDIGKDLEVPLPNGTTETFSMFESPILAPEIAAQHPEIKTYAGKGHVHKSYSIRINLTQQGFNAIILGVDNDAIFFEKTSRGTADNLYRSYFQKIARSPQNSTNKTAHNRCGTLDAGVNTDKPQSPGDNKRISASLATGTQLRTFRLAMAANGEFTAQRGGTAASAFAAITDYVNNMIAIYRIELSVSFLLVSGQNLVYTDATTDPYDNDDQGAMLTQNHDNLNTQLTSSGYDIGHVLGYAGGSGGGVAVRGSVCNAVYKGQGVSGIGDGSYADVFDQQLIQHEIGHQFDMSHSYNSNVPVCTTRAYETSVEPGAGTTIMSYGYTCSNTDAGQGLVGNDDYETPYAPILNFHAVNYDQANAFISGLSCYTTTATNNAIPVIAPMQTSWTIPKSTPFVLTGSASDADAVDVLSYSWEGTNLSDQTNKELLTGTTLSDATKPPFFRTYAPVPSTDANAGTRYFPRLSAILSGSNYAVGDKLPAIGIVTTHRLSVRDNNSGVNFQDVTVAVDGNSGPFLVTSDLSDNYVGGTSQTITWSVNNTDVAPVNCTFVDIWLSTDGGITFPTLLISTANDGSESVAFPTSVSTTTARIKVAASNNTSLRMAANGRVLATVPNIFFDISNTDFSITAPLPVTLVTFTAALKGKNNAVLNWQTASETNNTGFVIEMGNDPRTFASVGFVDGKGDSKVTNKYEYTISDLASGSYYFRLKQTDRDGKFEYSTIRAIEIRNAEDLAMLYPNPTNGKLKIKPGIYRNEAFTIQILNQAGKEIMFFPSNAPSGTGQEVNVAHLPTGLYHVILRSAKFTENLKFVKM
ncbi:zinc-dependent metalloprotease [Dyadobacter sp. 32]|uniref:reprolysin-like metallopeptidase n=1 Tax=Dyadobacter sp. 32 TaxID=538966 RepID=UPI0011ED020F